MSGVDSHTAIRRPVSSVNAKNVTIPRTNRLKTTRTLLTAEGEADAMGCTCVSLGKGVVDPATAVCAAVLELQHTTTAQILNYETING